MLGNVREFLFFEELLFCGRKHEHYATRGTTYILVNKAHVFPALDSFPNRRLSDRKSFLNFVIACGAY